MVSSVPLGRRGHRCCIVLQAVYFLTPCISSCVQNLCAGISMECSEEKQQTPAEGIASPWEAGEVVIILLRCDNR